MSTKSERVSISLAREEAVVFFDWLSRLTESEVFRQTIEDEAEETVTNGMVCDLESILTEPLLGNYKQILEQYRKKIKGS